MIEIQILPGDFFTHFTFYFTVTNEGKSNNPVMDRMFAQFDKKARQIYGLQAYNIHVNNLRKEIAKQKK